MKEPPSVSHDDFILGYQSGRLGCTVNVVRVLLLFYSRRIREKRVVTTMICWSLGLLPVIGLSIVGFRYLPFLWAFLTAIVLLAVFALAFVHRVSEVALSAALTDEEFYQLGRMEQMLGIATDDEGNLPKLRKVVPMRDSRRAQR